MIELMTGLPTVVLGPVLIGLSFLVAGLGVLVVRRLVPLHVLKTHHEVATVLVTVIGGIFAVMLSLMVVVMWQQYDAARGKVELEADMVGDLYRGAAAFDGPTREYLRGELGAYATEVVEEEWPLMAHGAASPAAWETLGNIWDAYSAVEPAGQRQSAFLQQAVDNLGTLEDARRSRLLASQPQVPGVLWTALALCGSGTVAFPFLFGIASRRTQALLTGAFTAIVVFVLFTIMALDLPFTGDVAIRPDPFVRALAAMAPAGPSQPTMR